MHNDASEKAIISLSTFTQLTRFSTNLSKIVAREISASCHQSMWISIRIGVYIDTWRSVTRHLVTPPAVWVCQAIGKQHWKWIEGQVCLCHLTYCPRTNNGSTPQWCICAFEINWWLHTQFVEGTCEDGLRFGEFVRFYECHLYEIQIIRLTILIFFLNQPLVIQIFKFFSIIYIWLEYFSNLDSVFDYIHAFIICIKKFWSKFSNSLFNANSIQLTKVVFQISALEIIFYLWENWTNSITKTACIKENFI